jgi:hypothetical protein
VGARSDYANLFNMGGLNLNLDDFYGFGEFSRLLRDLFNLNLLEIDRGGGFG